MDSAEDAGGGTATPTSDSPLRLGDILVAHGATTTAVIDRVIAQSSAVKPVGAQLLEAQAINEQQLVAALAEHLQFDIVQLQNRDVDVNAIPENIAREFNAIALGEANGMVDVALGDPTRQTIVDLREALGKPVKVHLAPLTDVQTTLNHTYRALAGIDQYVDKFESTSTEVRVETSNTADAPVVQVVNLILMQAQRDRVSDVHIEPQGEELRIRFRVDGALHDAQTLPISMAGPIISRIKIMAGMNIVERRRPQDGQLAIELDGRAMDVRVATTSTVWGEKAVLRLLDKSRPLYRLDELGMPADSHELFSKMVRSPFGMVICAGPTGSGKTTTLYGTLNEINDPERNIMTIEDPVEYIFPSINQIQMNEQAGLSFADGLKSMLRQDPDVILVGEVRDAETARIAVQSALTGHFVLSSLHATDSAAALHRLLDMGVESFLISSSVLGIVAQRLVRRICTSCATTYTPTDEELAFYEEAGGKPRKDFVHGAGCNLCAGTGFKGRVGVYELLRVTPELKRLIVGWATQEEIRRMAMSQGMRTLRQEGIALVTDDVTTISEVIRSVYAL